MTPHTYLPILVSTPHTFYFHLELHQRLVVEALLVPDDLDGIHAVSSEVMALENLHGRQHEV